jgi:hypothetical protein
MIPTQSTLFALIDDSNLEQQQLASAVRVRAAFLCAGTSFQNATNVCVLRIYCKSDHVLSVLLAEHRRRIAGTEW